MNEDERLRKRADAHLRESAQLKLLVAEQCLDSIVAAARMIADCFRTGGKLLLCGNGGSAADCQHVAAEFVSRLSGDFPRPGLPAIALTTDTSFLTAHSNDYGFEEVFERQLLAIGREGDLLMGISTSGNSINVLRALEAARARGIGTIVLVGSGGRMAAVADVAIRVPSRSGQLVQESHLAIEHAVCDLAERYLFGEKGERLPSEAAPPRRAARRPPAA